MQETYQIIEMEPGCWRIEEGTVRCFLLTGDDRALLIDSGFGTGNLKETVERLTKLPVQLVNTHADRDHIGCNGEFPECWMHPAEYDRYGVIAKKCPPKALWEGDILDIGGWRFEVILISGHTPGSIALLERERRILIAGDSVQAGHIYLFGPGRNVPAYLESLRKLEARKGEFDAVWSSHGRFPVEPEIIPGLIRGAEKLLAGELSPKDPPMEVPAKAYDAGVAHFLYP